MRAPDGLLRVRRFLWDGLNGWAAPKDIILKVAEILSSPQWRHFADAIVVDRNLHDVHGKRRSVAHRPSP